MTVPVFGVRRKIATYLSVLLDIPEIPFLLAEKTWVYPPVCFYIQIPILWHNLIGWVRQYTRSISPNYSVSSVHYTCRYFQLNGLQDTVYGIWIIDIVCEKYTKLRWQSPNVKRIHRDLNSAQIYPCFEGLSKEKPRSSLLLSWGSRCRLGGLRPQCRCITERIKFLFSCGIVCSSA